MFDHNKVILVLHVIGVHIQEKGPDGITTILTVTSEVHVDGVRTLHDLGTNVNVVNDSLCTPMLITTLYDHVEMVEKLRSLDVELDVY